MQRLAAAIRVCPAPAQPEPLLQRQLRVLCGVLALLLLAALTALTPSVAVMAAPNHVATSPSQSQAAKQVAFTSYNWAGYVRHGSGFTSTSASWTVPKLKTTSDGHSSSWVGIDGSSSDNKYLIQTGTQSNVVNGKPEYFAWWELITPKQMAPAVAFTEIKVRPGDSMTGSVGRLSNGQWRMTIRNNTTKLSGSKTVTYGGRGTSAEWIQEDSVINGQISKSPDWGTVRFNEVKVNNRNPALSARERWDIVDSQGTQQTSTSSPTSGGDGFGVTRLAAGHSTRY